MQILGRHLRHPKAALRLRDHQALGRKPRQSFAHSAEAYAKGLAQLADVEALIGLEMAGEHICSQPLVGGLREACFDR